METYIKKIMNKIGENFIFSFIAAVITSLVVHFTFFANIIYNWDAMLNGPERLGVGIGEGRFLVSLYLDFLKIFGMGVQINYFNVVVGLLFMSLSVALIISIFKVKDKYIALFIVIIFVCFPSITSLNFHYYCANVYSFSCFLSVLGIYFILSDSYIKKILGSIFIAFSIGGYQAYVGIPLSILLIYYIIKGFFGTEKVNIKKFIVDAIFTVASFALYKIFLLIFESIYNIKAQYPLDLSTLFVGIIDTYKLIFTLPFVNYGGLVSYINSTLLLKLAFGISLLVSIIYIIKIIINASKETLSNLVFALVLTFFLPVAMFFIHIVSDRVPDSLMMQSYTFYIIFPLILHYNYCLTKSSANEDGNKPSFVLNTIICIMVLLFSTQYLYLNAYNYHALFEENRIAEVKYNQFITRIENCEGYYVNIPIAIIGRFVPFKSELNPYYEERTWYRGGYLISVPHVEEWIRPYFLGKYMDFSYNAVDAKRIEDLKKTPEFSEMGLYPDSNSIKVIDGVLVVKLPEYMSEIYRTK